MFWKSICLRYGLPAILVLIGFLLLLTLGCRDANGETITVFADGGADYENIQDAIDNATIGDTIRVYEGTYYENVVVNKRLKLVGNGSEESIIHGGGTGDVVYITADRVNMSRFGVTGSGDQQFDSTIKVDEADNVQISMNKCWNNENGIFIESSDNCLIRDNTCSNSTGDGIYLSWSEGCTVENNTLYKTGVDIVDGRYLENWVTNDFGTNNTVNGKPLYFYQNVTTGFTVPAGAGQVILINCTDMAVENQNCSDGSLGILVAFSSDIVIENNTCENNSADGIRTFDSRCVVVNNTCSLNGVNGIKISRSNDCSIYDNTVKGNTYGIYGFMSNRCTFTNNTASNNTGTGIFLAITTYCTTEGNDCFSNVDNGIWVRDSSRVTLKNDECRDNDVGIFMAYSDNCSIENVLCTGNANTGINIRYSNDLTITNSSCSFNDAEGIILERAHDSILTNNNFTSNFYCGIWVYETNRCTIENSEFSGSETGIDLVYSDECSIENVRCVDNTEYGIRFMEASGCVVYNSTISGNEIGIFLMQLSIGNIVYYNNIVGNIEYAISNEYIWNIIDAGYNWWGDASGPYHSSSNAQGTGNEITDHVLIEPFASSSDFLFMSMSPDPGFEGQSVSFEGEGHPFRTTDRYVWRSHRDGELYNGTESEFSRTDLSVGNHTIYFKVRYSSGEWSNEASKILFIIGKPEAIITSVSPDHALQGDAIHFVGNGTTSGTISQYIWNSSIDGMFYNGSEPDFYYDELSNGTHTIDLTVRDDNGFWSEAVSTTLTINGIPQAIIYAVTPNPASDTDIIHFEGYGTDDNDDGMLVLCVWRSSIDGEFYNGTESEFYYGNLSNGTHTIYLRVTDDFGVWSNEVFTTLIVNGIPRARMEIVPSPVVVSKMVSFVANATDDGTITQYSWRSSLDGELYNGTGSEFSLSDLSVGNHTIYLMVKDNYDVWSEKVNGTLIVHERPVAEIVSINPKPALEGDKIHFSGSGSDDGTITQYAWRSARDGEFHNGTESEFEYTGLSPGIHAISLTVMDDHGVWSNELDMELTVFPLKNVIWIPIKDENVTMEIVSCHLDTEDERYYLIRDHAGEYIETSLHAYSNITNGSFVEVSDSSYDILTAMVRMDILNGILTTLEISGLNTVLDIIVGSDLSDETIVITETPNSTLLHAKTLDIGEYPCQYLDILVSDSFLDAMESARIRVSYSEENVPEGLNESSLRLYYWNSTNNGWDPLAVGGVNTEENYVWANVSHFSTYGVAEFNFPPVADAGLELSVAVGEEVQLHGIATDNFNRDIIVLYEWDFDGDGVYDTSSTSSGDAVHIYESAGTYYAKLRVTDDGGGRGFDSVRIVVGGDDDDDSTPSISGGTTVVIIILVAGILMLSKRKKPGMKNLLLVLVLLSSIGFLALVPVRTVGATEDGVVSDTTIIDISTSDYRPVQGDEVTINATLFYNSHDNNGTYTTVWFGEFGNFASIGEDYTFTEPNSVSTTEIVLDTSDMVGEKIVFVMIKNSDPSDSNLSNNVGAATITLNIQPAEDDKGDQVNMVIISSIGVVGVVCAGALVFVMKQREVSDFQMTDVFLVFNDGRLITHETTKLRPTDFDPEVITSMLTAVQMFVTDTFRKDEEHEGLTKFEYDDFLLLIEKGKYVHICVVLSGSDQFPQELHGWLKEAIDEIEDRFSEAIEDWSGDSGSFSGVRNILREKIISRE